MLSGIFAFFGLLISILVSVWAVFKFLLFKKFRVNDNLSKIIMDNINRSSEFKFELNGELSIDKIYPSVYECFCFMNGVFVWFKREERLLNAGWQSKETISDLSFLRWNTNKIKKMINIISKEKKDSINVMLLKPYNSDRLGEITIDSNKEPEIFIDKFLYEDIERDIEKMLHEEGIKTGCLLWGQPGNGKTRLVQYFARKFHLPIYSIYLNPDFNNGEILSMFGSIPKKCIVLMEDFDNYFNGRECIMKNQNVKFTFDALLNALDGVYNDYKQVVFVMTVNDITKVDDAIKCRSSRFKFVREIKSPSYEMRMKILENSELALKTEGVSLDRVFFAKSLQSSMTNKEILAKLNNI